MIYRAICERLKTVDQVTDTITCLRHMISELAGETDVHSEQVKWVLGEESRIPRRWHLFDQSL